MFIRVYTQKSSTVYISESHSYSIGNFCIHLLQNRMYFFPSTPAAPTIPAVASFLFDRDKLTEID